MFFEKWILIFFFKVQTLRNAELKLAIKRSSDVNVFHQIEAVDKNLFEVSFTPNAIERHYVDVFLDKNLVSEGNLDISFIIIFIKFSEFIIF